VAELVDARDLKSCGAENAQLSCKTRAYEPIENDGDPARLQNTDHSAAIAVAAEPTP